MEIKKNKRKLSLLLSIIIIIIVVIVNKNNVNAAESSYTLTRGGKIFYNSTNYIIKHYFGSTPAYCMQWRLSTIDGSTYTEFTPSSMTERTKFIAGYAIDLVEKAYPNDEDKRHLYATEAINCLFGLSGSVCYDDGKQYIEKATKYVDNEEKLCEGTNTSGCLNNESFKLSQSSSMLNQIGTSSNFVSNKITLSGLLKTYGGSDFKVTYRITATSSAGNKVEICTNANGTGCNGSSITLTDKEGQYSFYVKVSDAKAASTVKINATAANEATYPYGVAYRYTSSYQALMIKDKLTVKRNLSRTLTLNVPDKTKYTISARKVDENGDDLTGASFEIYRADLQTGKEIAILKKNANGAATLSYIEEQFSTADEWFKYKYCLRETVAPSGYIYNEKNEVENPLCLPAGNSWNNGTYCYNEENEEVNDLEKCNSHTKRCASTQGNYNEESEQCELTSDIINKTEIAQGSCPSEEYTIDTTKNKCVKTEIVNEEEVTEEVDISYVCVEGERIENSETGEVSCVVKTCSEGYELKDNICVKSEAPNQCVSDRSAYNGKEEVDMSYCEDQTSYTFVTVNGGNIDFVKTNNKNSVVISKTDITGEKELHGAKMKVCTTKPNANLDCEVAIVTRNGSCSASSKKAGTCTDNSNNTMNVKIEWTSDITSRTIRGLETEKTYYLVETVAPLGYSISQYTKFMIKTDGTVVSEGSVVEDGKILVKNDYSSFTVSKQDITTSQELPGAEITICYAGKDEKGEYQMGVDQEGNCTIPVLSNGEDAKWISTDKPHEIKGLPAGAYYLVETITPEGYDTAEKILFIVNQNGSITDKDGNSIKGKKIIMYDKPIVNIPTGDIMIAIAIILGILGLSAGTYYYFKIYKSNNKLK